MTVRFSDAWTLHGLRALIVENRYLRVTVLPELGGKIWSIVSKRHDREMLWHNPRVLPRPAHYGATYDNWFCGGWDDVFPNDFPVDIDGDPYPDHGEVWSLPAAWRIEHASPESVAISLEHRGIALPTRFRKVLTLREDAPSLHLQYEITNEGASSLDVHWKTHPSLPLAPGARLHLPIGRVIDEPGFGEVFRDQAFEWPRATQSSGEPLDLSALPDPGGGGAWFFYGVDLTAGYAAISYPDRQVGFGLSFDPEILSSVWVFGSFGGWRGLNTIILEPCTGHLADLEAAIANRSVLTIGPGETVSTPLAATVLDGDDALASFERNGGIL